MGTKVSPMVEAGYQTIKSQVEEKVVPHIPANISESVSKNVSATLDTVSAAVEDVLKKTGTNEESTVVSGVRKIHSTANTIRISGISKAGTEKAKKIEEASIAEAVLFMLGVTDLLAFLGFKLAKTEEVEEKAEEKSDK